MDLQNTKTILNQAGFSPEALEELNKILDEAIAKEGLTNDGKKKLLEIVDLETERTNLEADTMEKLALALGSFVNDVDRAAEMAERDIQSAEADFDVGMQNLDDQAQQITKPATKAA